MKSPLSIAALAGVVLACNAAQADTDKLLLTDDVMHIGAQIPRNVPDDLLKDALLEMSRKGLGTTVVAVAKQGLPV